MGAAKHESNHRAIVAKVIKSRRLAREMWEEIEAELQRERETNAA